MSKKKKPSQPSAAQVAKAQAYLRQLSKSDTLSYAEMAEMLQHVEGLDSPSRNAIHSWVDPHYPISKITAPVRGKIIKAAETIKTTLESPEKITVGVIRDSTESILLHLLGAPLTIKPKSPPTKDDPYKKLPKSLKRELAHIPTEGATLHLVTKSDVPALVNALQKQKDALDFIVAPRNHKVEDCHNVKRLFRFMQCATCGLFPPMPKDKSDTQRQSSPADFADLLKEMLEHGERIGILQNGGYQNSLADFEQKQKKPSFEYVTSSTDAFKHLKSGDITAVIGHRVMCENTKILVEQELNKNPNSPHLSKRVLNLIPSKTLDPVKLDIWLNLDKLRKKPRVAAKLFQLLCRGVKYIDKKRTGGGFNALVNHLLKLDTLRSDTAITDLVKNRDGKMSEYAKEIQDAAYIFDEKTYYSTTQDEPKQYLFLIKTFETQTMEELWM